MQVVIYLFASGIMLATGTKCGKKTNGLIYVCVEGECLCGRGIVCHVSMLRATLEK